MLLSRRCPAEAPSLLPMRASCGAFLQGAAAGVGERRASCSAFLQGATAGVGERRASCSVFLAGMR